MKKWLMILLVIGALFLLAGCEIGDFLPFVTPEEVPVEVETLSADVEIINWVQDESVVAVNYEITNTGEVDIAYYKILFKVTYTDDNIYTTWYEKEGILFAGVEKVEVLIEVNDEVARIDVEDVKLTEWKFR